MFCRISLAVFAALLLAGCGREAPEPAAEAETPSPMPELWSRMNNLYMTGQTNDMLRVLEDAFAAPEFADHRGEILRQEVQLLLFLKREDQARTLFTDTLAENPDAAADAFPALANHYLQQKDYEGLDAWLLSLEADGVPDSMRPTFLSYRLEVKRALGDVDALLALLPECIEAYPGRQAVGIIAGPLNALIGAKQFDALDRALDLLSARYPAEPGIGPLTARLRIHAFLARDRLDEAAEHLEASLQLLNDAERARLLDALIRAAVRVDRTDLAERACNEALDRAEPGSRVFSTAARHTVDLAREAGDPQAVQSRFASLVEHRLPPGELTRILDDVFYFVVEKGDIATISALLADAEKVNARVTSEADRGRLATLLLDASFLIEDFDRALAILEAGVPDRDESWHAMLIPKVKAHRAMAAGNPEEAVREFRVFMEQVAAVPAGFPDPLTGDTVSRESILGLNAMRIAELWDEAGDPAKAAAAREEALAYYREALESSEAGSDAYNEIQKKITELEAAAAPAESPSGDDAPSAHKTP
ncbi:MAG: hypothetical protein JW951_00715 [Lentisphaerae bacterium]|nr:hypothetical protein [Lentisphaerota bacterium]